MQVKKNTKPSGSLASVLTVSLAALAMLVPCAGTAESKDKLYVVTTLTDYAAIAREIGGERVRTEAIAEGDEDPHFVRPKPSYAQKLAKADLFVTTGLDLELWAPAVIDKSQNASIREGQIGYVAVADGLELLEIPASADRGLGGVHIYGNPHIHTSPLNAKQVAKNIAIGLKKIDPQGGSLYAENLERFNRKIDEKLFGKELIGILGAKTLNRLARSGNLVSFLEGREFKGQKLIDKLGGWMKETLPLRGKKLVTYHKNWIYFTELFGFDVVGEVEPKPAIPPSPKDVEKLIQTMDRLDVKVVLAANYYDENKVKKICNAVGATPVIVPFSVRGTPRVKSYFQLVDNWVAQLLTGYGAK